jgi:hypothetical protein
MGVKSAVLLHSHKEKQMKKRISKRRLRKMNPVDFILKYFRFNGLNITSFDKKRIKILKGYCNEMVEFKASAANSGAITHGYDRVIPLTRDGKPVLAGDIKSGEIKSAVLLHT